MAVVNPEFNLAPSYQMVQQALAQRANLEAQGGAANPLAPINSALAPIAQQQQVASARNFELQKDAAKRASSAEPTVTIEQDDIDELASALGTKDDYPDMFNDLLGKKYTEKELQNVAKDRMTAVANATDKKKADEDRRRQSGERQASLEAERASKRDDKIRKEVIDYSEKLEGNIVTKQMKKEGIALGQMDQLIELVRGGNTVASAALGTKMARAMGEVGVLTESDVTRYIESGQLTRKAGDKLLRMIEGKPTDATIGEIEQIGTALRDSFQKKVQPTYDDYVRRLAINAGMPTSEAATRLQVPYAGNKIIRAKSKKSGDSILLELNQKGEPLREISF
jgi:hypothetical protein